MKITDWNLPDQAPNLYQEADIIKQVMEFRPKYEQFTQAAFETKEESNPYISPQDYQKQSGVQFNAPLESQDISPEGNVKKLINLDIIEVIEGKFIVKFDGLYLKLNKEKAEYKRLCNFSFTIDSIHILHNRDGTNTEEIIYSVVGEDVIQRQKNEPMTIPSDDYDRMCDEILKKYKECYICPEFKSMARDYIKEYGALIYRDKLRNSEPINFYSYHGWECVNGKMVYLSDSRSDCRCGVYVPKNSNFQRLWTDDLDILKIGKACSDPNATPFEKYKVSLPFWLYLHLSFACKLFLDAGIEVQFLLALIGKTGSLKTTICKTFAEPFNIGGILRFESTGRALELYRESCMDMTMIVDDIFKKNNANLSKFEDILRTFGDGIGRAKSAGKDYNDLVRTKVRGGCIVTAEHDLNPQQSSALRYISVNIEKDSIDTKVLSKYQQDQNSSKLERRPSMVQDIFGAWIAYLEEHYKSIVCWLINFTPPNVQFTFKRYQQIYRVLCAVIIMILEQGLELGVITKTEYDSYYEQWCDVIVELIKRNAEAAMISEPWQQFLLTLHQAIGTGSARMAHTKEDFADNGNGIKNYIGYKRDNEYVFEPTRVMSLVRRQILESGKELVADSTAIFKDLFENNISRGYGNQKDGRGSTRNRYLKRVKINGNMVEMLVISIDEMECFVNKILRG